MEFLLIIVLIVGFAVLWDMKDNGKLDLSNIRGLFGTPEKVATLETTITNLEARTAAQETTITNLEARIVAQETTITNLEARIVAIESTTP